MSVIPRDDGISSHRPPRVLRQGSADRGGLMQERGLQTILVGGGQAMFSLDSVALPHLGRVGTMSAKAGAGDTRVRTASWDM